MLNDTYFELKDFSRFFHDFFRKTTKNCEISQIVIAYQINLF